MKQQQVVERFRAGANADDIGDAVPDEMVDALTISGTPAEARDRLQAYEGLATTVKLTPPTHGLAPEETRQAQARIIELIADLTGKATL